MKHLWSKWNVLSRSQQIGICSFVAHAAIIFFFSIYPSFVFPPPSKKTLEVRTIQMSDPVEKEKMLPSVKQKRQMVEKACPVRLKNCSNLSSSKKEETVAKRKVAFKKTESFHEEGSSPGNAEFLELAKRLEEIVASKVAFKQSNFSLFLPSSLEAIDKTDTSARQPTYGDTVRAILQKNLVLPEFGEVVAKIEVNANGSVSCCEFLEMRSFKNGEFLKKQLQDLIFPCFNEFGIEENRLQFIITFRNVEDH